MGFLKEKGFSGLKVQNLIIPFDENIPERLRTGNYFKTTGGRKEAGISVKMLSGDRIEMFVGYV